jgi:hypothetical protein
MPYGTYLGSETMVVVSEARVQPVEPEPTVTPRGNGTACTAEVAECTCPDFCERDHDID